MPAEHFPFKLNLFLVRKIFFIFSSGDLRNAMNKFYLLTILLFAFLHNPGNTKEVSRVAKNK